MSEYGDSQIDLATSIQEEINKRCRLLDTIGKIGLRPPTRRERMLWWYQRKARKLFWQPIHDWTSRHGAYCEEW